MKAMIMAAGVGSRLMPLTTDIPKPMIPMGNVPLMESIVKLLHNHGFNDIICNLHYHADYISSYFRDGSQLGVSLQYSREKELLGTAGGVKNCEWFLNDTFVVISGDALTDIDLGALIDVHRRKGALATIALKEVEQVEHFGIVVTNKEGLIEKFQEKPKPREALSHLANTGIYIFEPEIFKFIPMRQFYDFGKQVFPHLVKIKAPFYGIPINEYWCDVGSISAYCQAHTDILQGKVRVNTSGEIVETKNGNRILLGKGTSFGNNIKFKGNIVIGAGCQIRDNVYLDNAIIWDNTVIGANSVIEGAVVGAGCTLGQGVRLGPLAVVAGGCNLKDNTKVAANSKVFYTIGDELHLEQG